MKICHVCGETFEDYVDICSDCCAMLKTEDEMKQLKAQETENGEEITIKNPVLVENVEDIITAEIFSDMLEEAGIPYFKNEDMAMRTGFGGNFSAVQFYVDENDLAAASQIYKDMTESIFLSDDDQNGSFEDDPQDGYEV